jgi:3-hydroxyisobutyrate dehydrogenase-like beta-hydroxyacid dehydrogenase
MMEVGLIGLGQMGAGIAHNLLRAGHQLTIFNRTRRKTEQFVAEGATIAERPADACNVDVVITSLAGDAVVEELVLGPGGLAAAMPAASTHVSMSSIGIALSRRLAAVHERQVQRYVAAPVFGRPDAAVAGELLILAGGRGDVIARCQPLFDVIGRRTVVVSDDPVAANLLQLSGNALIAAVIQSLGEAIALAHKGGISPERFMEVMSRTLFTKRLHTKYGALIAGERYQPAGLTAELGLKDICLVLDAADALDVPIPLMRLLHDQLNILCVQGSGELDWSASARLAARDAGLVAHIDEPRTDDRGRQAERRTRRRNR